MNRQEKQAYYEAIRNRYKKSSRQEQGHILDEFCTVCGYQRKYAIRKLGQTLKTMAKQRPGRISVYNQTAIIEVIRTIWLTTDQMCGKRLVAAIPEWLPHYEQVYQPPKPDLGRHVLSASAATLDRPLKPIRVATAEGTGGTKPGALLKNHIPPYERVSGMCLCQALWKLIPLPIVEIHFPGILSGAWHRRIF